MNFKPLGDKIVIKTANEDEISKGGIYIPEAARERSQKGVVVAVGTGIPLKNGKKQGLQVKVEDTILFGRYAGLDIKIEGDTYKILREDEVIAILEEIEG